MTSLRGTLLVAAPWLKEPNFERTVVLVSEHGDEGAMGVVLNRPSPVTVAEAAPALGPAVDEDHQIWVGGPVAPTAVVFLAEFSEPSLSALMVFGRVGFPSADAAIEDLADATGRTRVFAGYAGWGPGQLEDELERGDWMVEPAVPNDVFCEEPSILWRAVLERKGGRFRLIASMPPDPSLN